MESIKTLQEKFARPGIVAGIYLRAQRLAPVISVDKVLAMSGKGLTGDRYVGGGSRQITLVSSESLSSVSSFLGISVTPDLVRRNIVTSHINLLSLKGKRFKIGEVLLDFTGECHPCSRMEENLGIGGYNAMRGHGGITAAALSDGIIKIGDQIIPL